MTPTSRSPSPPACAHDALATRLRRNRLERRDLLWLLGAGTVAAALPGCAALPAGGAGEVQERQTDTQQAAWQFSQDLGAVQDDAVSDYIAQVGLALMARMPRQDLAYSGRVLNAHHDNAYTFPGGATGVTRGLLVDLQDEAELAALLGHELGHVNARHAGPSPGQTPMARAAATSLNAAAQNAAGSPPLGLGTQIGASALLPGYSREQERQADALGQAGMAAAGYPASGMVQLQQRLVARHRERPGLLETMFVSHPMSEERLERSRERAETLHAATLKAPARRERFMDSIASLRRIAPAIQACRNGELAMSRRAHAEAGEQFALALKTAPRDYAAHLRMAQCLQAQERPREALAVAETARTICPQEAQAHRLAAALHLGLREPGAALDALEQHDRVLPGDPGVLFMKAVALDGMGQGRRAAEHYARCLQVSRQGEAARFSAARLQSMGYTL